MVCWSAGGLLLLVVMYEVLEWRAKRIRRGHYTTFLSHNKQDAGEAASELRAHLKRPDHPRARAATACLGH